MTVMTIITTPTATCNSRTPYRVIQSGPIKSKPLTFVDVSAMRADFCTKFYKKKLNAEIYTLL